MSYKDTLNLPKTSLPIRAKSLEVQEEVLGFWQKENLYQQILQKNRANKKTYILHDGPPYPNGDIHLGHALNKILKDIVVKYKSMQGFFSPYVPGWDCHGLPIETQLIKELGIKRKELNTVEFRDKCKEYALKYVDLQRKEFIKLGVLGDWEKPYLTLDHTYEEKIVEVFGALAEKGYVFRGLKPIHWCPSCETALAEAELEYEDDRSPSIYVKFKIKNLSEQTKPFAEIFKPLQENPSFFVIWTTTPWTLPANVAIAVNPDFEYVFLMVGQEIFVLAEGLLENFIQKLEIKEYKIVGKVKGSFLEGILCKHPFMLRDSMVILGEIVTLEQGTGCVHIAPGHGVEDYQVGLKYKLPIVMPVDEKGYFTKEAGEFSGQYYADANKNIGKKMEENGSLLFIEFFKHPYPHCWRCKKPVIFRATEQWFVSIDHHDLRAQALKAVGNTKWFPDWGENRIRGMIETRPDWCISRQRSWGVPIPAFYCKKCKKPHMTGIFNQAIKALFKKEGSNSWFIKEAGEILPKSAKCSCGNSEFTKETDILDVWFESGVSHAAVLETRENLSWPADLYLEGSDQHRGWFQSSLLTSTGVKGRAPYNAVLTHGFTMDEKGKKMSKSLKNVVDPNSVVKDYGADVLRLWVASADFRLDMSAGENILKRVQEAYLKIRNTCRFLISNLYDFDQTVAYKDLLEIDKWILIRLQKMLQKVTKGYEEFEFHIVFHAIYDFCVSDLSAYYLDMSKDRLYCDGKDSISRRSCQTAISDILNVLVRLFAPILSFTAEDIYKYMKTELSANPKCRERACPFPFEPSIFLTSFPQVKKEYLDEKLEEKWKEIFAIREEIYRLIESARNNKDIAGSIEAKVELYCSGKTLEILESVKDLLPMVFIVSQVSLKSLKEADNSAVSAQNIKDLKILVKHAEGKKCERCWMWKEDVGQANDDHPTLCQRCSYVV